MPSPLYIYELLENIFSYLPYHDLRHSRLVSTYWNFLITTSPSMQRQLWKRPEVSKNPNAHFSNTWDAVHCSILRLTPFLQKQKALKRVLREELVSYEIWDQYEARESDFRRMMESNSNTEDGIDLNTEKSLQLCSKCCNLHPDFCYSNIHPLLRGLEYLVCITGEGSALIANICVIGEPNCPFLIRNLFNLAIYLVNIPLKWQRFQDDMFTRPVCTRLVITSGCGCYVLQNRTGITIREVVMVLAWECQESLKELRERNFDAFAEDLNVGEWLEMDDNRAVHKLLEEMQRLKGHTLDNADERARFGLRNEAEKEYTRKKQALETFRNHFVDKLSEIIALDVLEGTKRIGM